MSPLAPDWVRTVDARTLRADAAAGLLGALLVLPQGIAFATLAGLPPQYGLYSAVVPTIVAALAGSSLHVVSGPTNANSLAIFAALAPLAVVGGPQYIALALTVTVLVGVIQLAVGAARLGGLTDFISPSVLLGFTAGAALLIACYALPEAFDLVLEGSTGPFDEVRRVVQNWETISWPAAAVAAMTLAWTLLARRLLRPAPFMLIGLAAGWATAEALGRLGVGEPVRTIGHIPTPIPPLTLPVAPLETLVTLVPIAGALAIVALGQSVSIAKTVAARSGQHIDVNREFIGQGLANVLGGFFSSYLSCGSLNRSVPNLEAGAKTPLAAVFSAVLLVALVAAASPLIQNIPTAAVAALLLYTAWSLLEVRRFLEIGRVSRTEFAIAAVTLVAMLVFPFHVAILIGVAFSLVAFLHRTAHPNVLSLAPDRETSSGRLTPLDELGGAPECPQLKLLRIEGATYFGAAQYVADRLAEMRLRTPSQKRLLVMARSMNFLDVAGAELWEREMQRRRIIGGDLYFHRPRRAVLDLWRRTGFITRLGPDHVFDSKREAIGAIYRALDPAVCAACTARIFRECGPTPATAAAKDAPASATAAPSQRDRLDGRGDPSPQFGS